MKNIGLLLIIICIIFPYEGYSQNDISISHYVYNELSFNPSAMSNNLNATIVARKQWVGFEGSPMTEFVNGSAFVPKIYGGVGMSLVNDKVGYENTINFKVMYSYPVELQTGMSLSLGLGVGFVNKSFDGTKLRFDDASDPYAFRKHTNSFKPDFNFGAELNTSDYAIGIASTHLDRGVKGSSLSKNPRHYYLYGKYKFDISDEFVLVPYLLLKSTWYRTQLDINALVYYNKMVWGGLSFRTNSSVVFLLGYQINKEWKVGYSYDYTIGKIKTYEYGSHELMVSATFGGFNKDRVTPKTPRLFE
jgi:type IX secretion system PorP/SprF family membrane protein